MTVTIKSGDTGIIFTDTLTLNGVPYDGTDATVLFVLKPRAGGSTFSDTGTFDPDQSTNPGVVTYAPGTGFPTAISGYNQEWQVTTTDALTITFPGNSYNLIEIIENLSQ